MRIGFRRGSGGVDNPPPRTTWLQPSPRSLCSAEGSVRQAFGAADLPVAPVF
jgi:hypothetical protein